MGCHTKDLSVAPRPRSRFSPRLPLICNKPTPRGRNSFLWQGATSYHQFASICNKPSFLEFWVACFVKERSRSAAAELHGKGFTLENQKIGLLQIDGNRARVTWHPAIENYCGPRGVGLLQINGSLGKRTRSGSGCHTKVLSVTPRPRSRFFPQAAINL